MRTFFVLVIVAGCLVLAGCGSGGGQATSTTSTDGTPTTEQNVRPDYKKKSMGQGQPFTSEDQAVQSLPADYPRPGDQSKRLQGQ